MSTDGSIPTAPLGSPADRRLVPRFNHTHEEHGGPPCSKPSGTSLRHNWMPLKMPLLAARVDGRRSTVLNFDCDDLSTQDLWWYHLLGQQIYPQTILISRPFLCDQLEKHPQHAHENTNQVTLPRCSLWSGGPTPRMLSWAGTTHQWFKLSTLYPGPTLWRSNFLVLVL